MGTLRHTTLPALAAALAAAAGLSACTSHTTPVVAAITAASTVAPTTVAPATRAVAPAATTTKPTPAATKTPPKLGDTITYTDDGSVIRFTVSDYTTRVAGTSGAHGRTNDRIATLTVKACLDHGPSDGSATSFSWYPWTLVFADGSSVPALSEWSASDYSAPLYPNDSGRIVPVGDCRTGLIPFQIPESVKQDPTKVEYSAGGQLVTWAR